MTIIEMVGRISKHRFAIISDGLLSQCRFDTEAAAQIALRNYISGGGK